MNRDPVIWFVHVTGLCDDFEVPVAVYSEGVKLAVTDTWHERNTLKHVLKQLGYMLIEQATRKSYIPDAIPDNYGDIPKSAFLKTKPKN